MQFDHIGIFVSNLEQGRSRFRELLNIVSISEEFYDPLLKVAVQFLIDSSGIRYEIIAPNGPGNPVEPILTDKRNILNHIAYRADDFDACIERLRKVHYMPLGRPQQAVAFQGRRVVFLLSPLRMIIEIIETV